MFILIMSQFLFDRAEKDKTNGFNQILLKHQEKCKYCKTCCIDHFSLYDQYRMHENHLGLLEEIGKHFKTCSDPFCNCKRFVEHTKYELDEIKRHM